MSKKKTKRTKSYSASQKDKIFKMFKKEELEYEKRIESLRKEIETNKKFSSIANKLREAEQAEN